MLLPEVFDTVLFNSTDDSDLDAPFSCDLATSNYWLTLLLSIFDEFQLAMVAHRLEHEYGVKARIMGSQFNLARWVTNDDASAHRVALDAVDAPTLLVDHSATLRAVEQQWPSIRFHALREHAGLVFQSKM